MTWTPRRDYAIDFSSSWSHILREFGLIEHSESATLYGSDAWAFSAAIHLQSVMSTNSASALSYKIRLWFIWNAARSDRAKLGIVERIAEDYVNDRLTPNEAREQLEAAGLYPWTLKEAGLVEDIPREIGIIHDDKTFQIALDSYRKNRL